MRPDPSDVTTQVDANGDTWWVYPDPDDAGWWATRNPPQETQTVRILMPTHGQLVELLGLK